MMEVLFDKQRTKCHNSVTLIKYKYIFKVDLVSRVQKEDWKMYYADTICEF